MESQNDKPALDLATMDVVWAKLAARTSNLVGCAKMVMNGQHYFKHDPTMSIPAAVVRDAEYLMQTLRELLAEAYKHQIDTSNEKE